MFLTKLPKYTDLVRASNTRVDADSSQRLWLESFEEIRQKCVSMKVTQTNLHSVFPLSFLTLEIAHWKIFLPVFSSHQSFYESQNPFNWVRSNFVKELSL